MVILLVDENTQVRNARAGLLRARNHQVTEAPGAVEAVEIAQSASHLDLLVTEVVLGEGHFGFDLREAILARLPDMRTVFTTRYDLTGYEGEMNGVAALPETASEAEFLAAVHAAEGAGPAVTPSSVEVPPIMPVGTVLGDYQILDRLYTEPEAETYRALQLAVQRPVGLVLLKPHLLNDAEAVLQFKDRERVKASISHPRVAPLYEAGEANGWLFYTRELPPGKSLKEIAAAGGQLGERQLVDVLHRISEAMSYGVERGYNYRTLNERDIYVDDEHQTSIVNIFRPPTALQRDQESDVHSLLDMLAPFVSQGKARGLLHDLSSQPLDWSKLELKLRDIRDDMSERSLIHRAASEDIAVSQPPSKRWPLLAIGVVVLAIFAYLGMLSGGGGPVALPTAEAIDADEMVHIPAGKFIFQKNQHLTLREFWISKYEVTIGQYALFLAALKVSAMGAYDDPNQPAEQRDHQPADWDALYAAAKNNGQFNKQTITLDTPISGVDYWDAVAYAKWKGHRLPSEQEWERAARGKNGNLYPWGSEPRPGAANLGDDYQPEKDGGQIDGYNLWSPVNKPDGDVTEEGGIHGMAGNVQEWATGDDPDVPGAVVPVLRGGHFAKKSSAGLLTDRRIPDSPTDGTHARGIRTVSDTGK